MSEAKKMTVEIYGKPYILRVTEENADTVARVAAHVDEMMQRIGGGQPRLDFKDIAVLAAMGIAEELEQQKQDYQELLDILDEEK